MRNTRSADAEFARQLRLAETHQRRVAANPVTTRRSPVPAPLMVWLMVLAVLAAATAAAFLVVL